MICAFLIYCERLGTLEVNYHFDLNFYLVSEISDKVLEGHKIIEIKNKIKLEVLFTSCLKSEF